MRPFRFGGRQECGLFPGTENLPGIASFCLAVKLHLTGFLEEHRRLEVLSREGLAMLRDAAFDFDLESPPDRAAGVLCISLPWVRDMEGLLFFLTQEHICISRFSACSATVTGQSRILLAMGRSSKRAATSLRIALGRFSKREDLFRLARAIEGYRAASRHSTR